ncbi:Protein kinase-like domain [Pseudocohnilembus persalinus]|uniref:Protein kinase-like domain n=1 Tax=Pseudocohnilembus persalinus TaxID=266149 RepID=A0A0V0QAN0_PSEPJ|nr:Protein kinase-like domain [Pseudocohnilembus persalinus]|eukprot:KRW99278.1 Protein kinase-like domain [Pseudocohnilembus persalinus]
MASKRPDFKEGQMIRDYKIVKYISQGSYGQIYEAVNVKSPEKRLALKALYQRQFREHSKLLELYDNEVNLLKKLKGHPNICEYMNNFEDMKFKYLVMEFCNGGDLIQELKRNGKFSEEKALAYIGQILEAFKALHATDKQIIHRDIKLDNIFLHDGNCKLGDFGFAREVPEGKNLAQTWCGSLLTMAPEVIDNRHGYGIAADIYSLGAILYQGLFGDFPYKCYNEDERQLQDICFTEKINIKQQKMNLSKNGVQISEDCKDLLRKMLTFDPNQRITFQELYNHKFFNKSGKTREYFGQNQEELQTQKVEVNKNQNLLQTIQEEEDIQINIKLIGQIGVGKTSLFNSYIMGNMNDNTVTLGTSVEKKVINVGPDSVQINLYDTAGMEKHNALGNQYYKQSDAYLLVFDISDQQTYDSVDFWISEIKKNDQNDFNEGVQGINNIVVVATKTDLAKESLNSERFNKLKQRLESQKITVVNTSAKTRENLDDIFLSICKKIYPIKKNNLSQIQVNQRTNNNQNIQRNQNPSIKPSQLRAGSSNVQAYQKQKEKQKKGCC